MKRSSLVLITLVAGVLAQAQKPDWPQPIIKGSAVIWGSDDAKEAAKDVFVRQARNAKILVVSNTADTARKTWADVDSAKVVSTLDASDLDSFTAVWLDSFMLGNSETREKLGQIKNAGGIIGMPEELLETGRFSNIFPHLNFEEDDSQDSGLAMVLSTKSVVLLQGRYLRGYGEGATEFLLLAGAGKEATTVDLRARGRLDLISLKRRSIDRTMAPFPVAKKPEVKNGALMIVGGGGLPSPMIERFIELAGGPDALIVYVPCSFEEEIAQEPGFVRLLKSKGAKNVTWIHTKDRVKSDTDEKFLEPLKKAKGVWFGGGRQWNLVDSYMDTKAHELFKDVLKRGGVIGGSSAGASIQAEFLARGDPLGNLNILAPGYLRGLGFLPGAAVDQHFTQRGRQPNMTELMTAYPQVLGIGIDEATAIIVQGTMAEVLGNGSVHFYDYRTPPKGEVDYLKLADGKKYDLANRKELGRVLLGQNRACHQLRF